MNEIRWGFIGCGDVTEIKSGPAFNKIDHSRVVAVMRRDAAKAEDYANRHGVPRWYNDADKLINDSEVNAIYVATPPSTHMEYTIRAAEAGLPVYVEKPMAANYNECVKMIDACKSYNVSLFVAYYRRRLPLFVKVKELVDSSVIGEIQAVCMRLFQRPKSDDFKKNNLPWRVNPEVAGAGYFYDLASHQFDYLDYVFGPIKQVTGNKSNLAALYSAEDTVSAAFEFESGIQGSGIWSFNSGTELDHVEIVGNKGKIEFSTFDKKPIQLTSENGREIINCDWPDHVHQPLLQTVIEELRGEGKCPSTGQSGARTNRVMDKVLGR